MKKFLLLIALIPCFVQAQQTYFTPGIPPSSLSFTPTFRFKNGSVDSLNNIYLAIGNKWYQVYTAAQANARFTGGGGTSTGINGLNGTANIGLGGTLGVNTYIHNGGFSLSMDSVTFGSSPTLRTRINNAAVAVEGASGFGSVSFNKLQFGSGVTNYFQIQGGASTNTITGNPINITPKVSFAVNPALGATSTAGYVPTATNTSGDWSWAAPSGGVTAVTGTTNRITSTGGSTPVIDISASYAGQSSIVNVGTLVSGVIDFSLLSGTPPTWNQNTTGTAANLSGTPTLPNGTAATTQSAIDNSTKLATTAFVQSAVSGGGFVTASSTTTFTNKDLTSGTNTFPTFNQNTTGTALNITATSNSTITTLSALSLPYSQLTGTPSLSGYVPYSGATTDLALGANNLSDQSETITGTGGAGFIDMVAQSSPPSTPSANHQHIYADGSGRFTIMGSNGFAAAFTKSGLTASRVYTLPDSTGIIALENRIIPNANLANSAVTVNGTSISLGASGIVTAAAGTLTGVTLNSTVTASSLTSFGVSIALGTPASGVMTNVTGLPLTTGVTGVLPTANGGTNLSSYTAGDLPYASATNVLSKLAIGATGNPLTVIGGVPAYSNLVLTNPASAATFTLAAGKTFTNNNTFTINSTDGITMTTPTTSFTAARTDAANTFTGTQTFGTIAATLVQGSIQSNSGGLNTSNLYTPTVTGFVAQSGATLIYGGATTTQGRVILGNGSTALSLTGGNSYANVLVGQGATITVPNATTSTWITQLAITPLPTITKTGTGAVTNTATAFFSAASSAGTNNYTAYFDTGNLQIANGNLTFASIGNGIAIKEGTNAAMGTGTLSGGTLVISNTRVTANSRIFLTDQGGTVTNLGSLYISARSAGTSFTVNSSNVLDASTFAWVIIEPAP